MSPSDIFQKERADYLRALETCLAKIRQSDPKAVSEVLVEVNTSEIPRPYRLMRPDILYTKEDAPKISRVVKDEWITFEPFESKLTSGVSLTLHPFQWDKLELTLCGQVKDWLLFEQWIHRWLDVDDQRSLPDVDFSGLIHCVSQPVFLDDIWRIDVDMGSADLDALNDLFHVLGAVGFEAIELRTAVEN